MVAIARGLMARPRLLMIDELSLGLAPIMLDTLLEHGYRYAFVSNSDNLGAVLDAPNFIGGIIAERRTAKARRARRTAGGSI